MATLFAQAAPVSSPGFGATTTTTTTTTTSRNEVEHCGKYSPTGIAILLMESLVTLLEPHESHGIVPLNGNNAVFWAERLIKCQTKFKKQRKPTRVDIGYHYTSKNFIQDIRDEGLMTIDDRTKAKHANTKNQAYFGNGIYLANNPYAFQRFGSHGIMVAVLTGTMHDMGTNQATTAQAVACDTTIGNKHSTDEPFCNEIIPRKSCQVLPLVQFKRDKVLKDADAADALWSVHEHLQDLLDQYFNGGKSTFLTRFGANGKVVAQGLPLHTAKIEPTVPFESTPVKQTATIFSFGSSTVNKTSSQSPPVKPPTVSFSFGGTPQNPVKNPPKRLGRPFGAIHFTAPETLLSDGGKEPVGRSPTGTMQVSAMDQDCAGFAGVGTICICYLVPGAKQKAYHVSPGEPFQGIHHETYIPNTPQGQQLLERLEYAFLHGLTFDVLPSHLTTATHPQQAYLAWLPFQNHRASMEGTSHTWLDPNYFHKCNSELDILRVPQAPGHHPKILFTTAESGGWGDVFKHLTENKWKRGVCDVNNDMSRDRCSSCESPKGAQGTGTTSTTSSGNFATPSQPPRGAVGSGFGANTAPPMQPIVFAAAAGDAGCSLETTDTTKPKTQRRRVIRAKRPTPPAGDFGSGFGANTAPPMQPIGFAAAAGDVVFSIGTTDKTNTKTQRRRMIRAKRPTRPA